jgi:transposase-like protein
LDLKHLLKRGALLAAANWQSVVIQFAAETTFQVLLAMPIIGAAILVAVLLGADLADLLQGSLRDMFTTIASTLLSEPVALVAFMIAFTLVLLGGSVLMFVVKGGTVEVLAAATAEAGPIEQQPLTFGMLRGAGRFTLQRFTSGCGRLAGRYERSQARQDTRAGSYERTLQTSAGEVNLKVPKLRRQTFETAIIDRYRRRESSVEEALIEMYLAGISVRRVEDITEALWGTRVSPSTVSNLNKKIYAKIEAWRNRRIEGEHPYLYLDGIVMKRTWAGEVRNVSLLVASAVNSEGFREILGICEGAKEDKSGWSAFLRHLVDRGLNGVQLIISDACRGLMESAAEYLPDARWQRCMVHFYRNIFSHVPATKVREVSHMLKAIHSQENRNAADRKARAIVEGLRAGRMNTAADLVERSVHETLTYYAFPDIHWHKIRTNNPLERIMREIRRRTRVVGAFPDGQSCLNLAAARLRYIAGTAWSAKCYMNMRPLYQPQVVQTEAVA